MIFCMQYTQYRSKLFFLNLMEIYDAIFCPYHFYIQSSQAIDSHERCMHVHKVGAKAPERL